MKTITVPAEEVSEQITEWKNAVFGQILGNKDSYFNLRHLGQTKWGSKVLLETQKVDKDLFLFHFQTQTHKKESLDLSPLPLGNRMLYLWPWNLDKNPKAKP